jgi:HK97 family phage major capsid protein
MSTRVVNNQMEALMSVFTELEQLSTALHPTDQQKNRMSFLLAKQSMLRQGVTEKELNRAHLDRLLREVGQEDRMPGDPDESVNRAWGARVKELRSVYPSSNVAGTQVINYTEGSEGGYLVPQAISARLYETMKQYDQIFDYANVIETENGNNLPLPVVDDVATSAVLVGESTTEPNAQSFTTSTDTDLVNSAPITNLGVQQIGAASFRSGMVVLSRELEQDSAFPWGVLLEKVFAKRFARGIGSYLTTGTGLNGQPTGLITAVLASGVNPVIASGSSSNDGSGAANATVGTQDVASLFGSVDQAYRMKGVFFMSPNSFVSLMKLLDKNGRPIINFINNTPFIYGRPVALCPSIPSIGSAGNNVMLFGDPDYFVQRRATGMTNIRRYTQKYGLAETFSVGYEAWMRVDSKLLAPNSAYLPFGVLQQHS